MSVEILKVNREKRWDRLLNYAYSECDRKFSNYQSTETADRFLISEISEIRFASDSNLQEYLSSTIAPTLSFTDFYQSIKDAIPIEWFQNSSSESLEQNFQLYNNLSVLAGLNDSTRQMIWIDIPRTFNIFFKRSRHCQNILSQINRKEYYLTVLCRILSMTSCLLGGWYCQGMSFVAASYIFYYDDISESLWSFESSHDKLTNQTSDTLFTTTTTTTTTTSSSSSSPSPSTIGVEVGTLNEIKTYIEPQIDKVNYTKIESNCNFEDNIDQEIVDQEIVENNDKKENNDLKDAINLNFNDERFATHELYACCTYYHLILQSNNLSALYEWSVFLAMYLEEFEFQLSHTSQTQDVYNHLRNLKYPIEFFSMEWFTTCYVLSTSYEVTVYIQDMMIYGNPSGSRVDILIRIGMSIILNLREEILAFEGSISLHYCSILLLLLLLLFLSLLFLSLLTMMIFSFFRFRNNANRIS